MKVAIAVVPLFLWSACGGSTSKPRAGIETLQASKVAIELPMSPPECEKTAPLALYSVRDRGPSEDTLTLVSGHDDAARKTCQGLAEGNECVTAHPELMSNVKGTVLVRVETSVGPDPCTVVRRVSWQAMSDGNACMAKRAQAMTAQVAAKETWQGALASRQAELKATRETVCKQSEELEAQCQRPDKELRKACKKERRGRCGKSALADYKTMCELRSTGASNQCAKAINALAAMYSARSNKQPDDVAACVTQQ